VSESKQPDYLKRAETFLRTASKPFREVLQGCRTGAVPWRNCIIATLGIQFLFFLKLDRIVLLNLGLAGLYPRNQNLYLLYYYFWISFPLLAWGTYRAFLSSRLTERLSTVFRSIGLQNRLGKLPNLIYDVPLDEVTRKLRLSMSALPLSEFQKCKPSLESALHVFIDEMREDRVKGAIDIIYSHSPMPEALTLKEYKSYHASEFTVGTTRSKLVRATLTDVPHLLVAGQTGGGKSTFLRHFITSLYLSDKHAKFTLIDLKGGLEFQLFENLPRITVSGDMAGAVELLKEIDEAVKNRMKLLKENKCKDIGEYRRSGKAGARSLPREVIVVDEAAEMFLTSALAAADKVRAAKEILSRVARQGRSLGIHLVIATQRPDSRALDPQIKANLPGVLCFQMVNDISSITVLGTGRATDLPPVPGRGIWKTSNATLEIQTPNLPTERADTLLAPLRNEPPSPEENTSHSTPPETPSNKATVIKDLI